MLKNLPKPKLSNFWGRDQCRSSQKSLNLGLGKNKLVEFAPKFAVDLIDLIEQNRRNSELFRGQFY